MIKHILTIVFMAGIISLTLTPTVSSFFDRAILENNQINVGDWNAEPDYKGLVINEVLYDPIGSEPQGEWVEIYNGSNHDIDLKDFKLTDGESELILSSKTLHHGEFAVFARDNDTFSSNYGFNADFSGSTMQLADGGDDIALYDPIGGVVDAVTWKNGKFEGVTPFPGVKDQGSSIARNPDGVDTDDCSVDFVEDSTPTPKGSNV